MEQNACCEDCRKSTAGRCFRHSQIPLDNFAPWLTLTASILNSSLPPLPICIACGGTIDVNIMAEITLPYGSRYDGEHLCSMCISASVDPIIDSLRSLRAERQGAKTQSPGLNEKGNK